MRYSIAGLTVEMAPSGRTAEQAAPYEVPACSAGAQITVTCSPQRILAANPELNGLDDAEYLGTGASFARSLLRFDGFQLHAAAVALSGRAYLFSGPCGVGKSTHGEKWVRLFGAALLNDDKPALRRGAGGWTAYGTPWSGKWDKSLNRGAAVAGAAFLLRGEENHIRPLSPAEALPALLSQVPRALSRTQAERFWALADGFLREVPLWALTCRDDDDAARLAHAAMAGDGA